MTETPKKLCKLCGSEYTVDGRCSNEDCINYNLCCDMCSQPSPDLVEVVSATEEETGRFSLSLICPDCIKLLMKRREG